MKQFVRRIKQYRSNLIIALMAVLIVTGVGIALWSAKAASSVVATDPENGTLSSPAMAVSDSSASNGKAIKFSKATPLPNSCTLKPSATTVGASGPLTSTSPGDITLTSGQTLENTYITNGGITINGDNVTVRNVRAAGGMFIYLSNGVMVDHFTSNDGIAISSSTNVTLQYSNIGPTTADSIHITSDRGSMNQNITLAYNYVHDPQVPPDAHYDGTQVRGVNGLSITCSVYDAGPYQPMDNAEVYLEDANGGNSNVTVANNWLYGGGFSVMIDSVDTLKLLNNRLGGDVHWNFCDRNSTGVFPNFVSTGNVVDADNSALALCQ